MIELILFAVYLLSAILSYRYINLAYSDNGRWSTQFTGLSDFLFMITPIINTLFCLFGWLLHYPVRREKDYNKFFKIKK